MGQVKPGWDRVEGWFKGGIYDVYINGVKMSNIKTGNTGVWSSSAPFWQMKRGNTESLDEFSEDELRAILAGLVEKFGVEGELLLLKGEQTQGKVLIEEDRHGNKHIHVLPDFIHTGEEPVMTDDMIDNAQPSGQIYNGSITNTGGSVIPTTWAQSVGSTTMTDATVFGEVNKTYLTGLQGPLTVGPPKANTKSARKPTAKPPTRKNAKFLKNAATWTASIRYDEID